MLEISGATDRGLCREVNEDRFAGEVFRDNLGYAVVCDGMGGVTGGGLASGVASEEVRRLVESSLRPRMDERARQLLLDSAVQNANYMVLEKAKQAGPEYQGMGTTLCLALFHEEGVTVANVGDSRCYLLREDELYRLTSDHTVVQRMVEAGELSEEAAASHPKRHLITKAVGVEPELLADYSACTLHAGDILLLCTDGLYNMIPEKELPELIRKAALESDVSCLIEAANAAGGEDNITAVVVHNRWEE